ncbi:MAG: sulfite exporter TauE/SafE family protein [Candidatus Sumerlaeota bacterium]|nr:sulfite exporter TauE/SafE family protein [Candidatus Sumerlaeota bacterium]
MTAYLWLIPLGFCVGAFGTLIGAGGGFILAPLLLLLYPHEQPDIVTSISLAVACANAISGSYSYALKKRVDYRSGLLFSAATVPGAILGALATHVLPRNLFDGVFGGFLLLAAGFLLAFPRPKTRGPRKHGIHVTRHLVESDGTAHSYTYNPVVGFAISIAVGFVSSFLGIGGGIIHVPVLSYILDFPVHIATATSHFMLAIMALAGTLTHVATGAFHHGVRRTIALAIGVVLGAPLGARFSDRVQGRWIIRALAVSLALVGLRLIILAFEAGQRV